jgi:branched-subunit amino acid aminotransferase/4-amino-4-deoxychorismate lyase
MQNDTVLWLNGETEPRIIPAGHQTKSPLVNQTVAFFETMRFQQGKIPIIHEHFARMLNSERVTYIDSPRSVSVDRVLDLLNNHDPRYLVSPADKTPFRVRLTVYEPLDNATKGAPVMWSLTKSPLAESLPFRLTLSSVTRFEPNPNMLSAKTGHRAQYNMALNEAIGRGFDDALMLSDTGFISETTIANLFWYSGGQFFYPSRSCYPLEGIGLRMLLNALNNCEISHQAVESTLPQLLQADVVWIINALRGPVPVAAVDQHLFRSASDNTPNPASIYWDYIKNGIGFE